VQEGVGCGGLGEVFEVGRGQGERARYEGGYELVDYFYAGAEGSAGDEGVEGAVDG
jgi:hypothetical protein